MRYVHTSTNMKRWRMMPSTKVFDLSRKNRRSRSRNWIGEFRRSLVGSNRHWKRCSRFSLDEWLSRIEADNPAAAEAFQARIRHWIEVIRQHPQAGHRHPKRREIRTVVESPIIIYYTVSASQIEILRFWHSARNPRSIRYR